MHHYYNGIYSPAGDHVKFGLPFGATTLLLLWGVDIFKDGYQRAGQLDEFYDMIKWATDYMLDAWNPRTKELVVQVSEDLCMSCVGRGAIKA